MRQTLKRVETEINLTLYDELRSLSRERHVSMAIVLREALNQYVYKKATEENNTAGADNELACELKKSTNRICALLAKLTIDTSVLAHFIFDGLDEHGKELFKEAYSKGIKRLKAQLTPDEKTVSDQLKK